MSLLLTNSWTLSLMLIWRSAAGAVALLFTSCNLLDIITSYTSEHGYHCRCCCPLGLLVAFLLENRLLLLLLSIGAFLLVRTFKFLDNMRNFASSILCQLCSRGPMIWSWKCSGSRRLNLNWRTSFTVTSLVHSNSSQSSVLAIESQSEGGGGKYSRVLQSKLSPRHRFLPGGRYKVSAPIWPIIRICHLFSNGDRFRLVNKDYLRCQGLNTFLSPHTNNNTPGEWTNGGS